MIRAMYDSNETIGNGRRIFSLEQAIADSKDFGRLEKAELETDLRFLNEAGKAVNVELKEIDDFWASMGNGHLGSQLVTMASQKEDANLVVVYGSLNETMAAIPRVFRDKGRLVTRTPNEVINLTSRARALCSVANSCNIPIHFFSSNHLITSRWVLGYVKSIMEEPGLAGFLPRFPVDARAYAMLCMVPNIGDVTARTLLDYFRVLSDLVECLRDQPSVLVDLIGYSKTNSLLKTFGFDEEMVLDGDKKKGRKRKKSGNKGST